MAAHRTSLMHMRQNCLAACASIAFGCSALHNCPAEKPAELVDEGTSFSSPFPAYESASTSGPLHEFPAKTRLIFLHHLDVTPEFPDVQLSFSKDVIGGFVPGAGNESTIDCVDDEVVVVRNDSCESALFVRVTAIATGQTTGSPKCPRE